MKLNVDSMVTGKNYYGLDNCLFDGSIKIHFNGTVDSDFSDLIIIDMSGQGCRYLETLHENKINWIDFIEHFLSCEGSHLARLDIACDDKPKDGDRGILSFKTMCRHVAQKRYICLARTVKVTTGSEEIILFGAPKSDRKLRIYNKALEKGLDGHWIRAEFQFRNDTALSFYMRALELGSIGQAYQGMLYDYLRFTKEQNNRVDHQNRLNVCRWWLTFCANAKKIKGFYIGGVEYNLSNCKEYLRRQVSSSAITYLAATQGNSDDLMRLFEGATLNKKQEFVVRSEILKNSIDWSGKSSNSSGLSDKDLIAEDKYWNSLTD